MQMFLLITQCYAIIAGDFKKCDETFCGHFRTADYSQNKFNLDSYVFLNNILKGSIKREDNVLDFELSFTKDAIKFITKTSENQYKFEDETTPIPLETTYKSFNDHLSLKLDNKELLVTKYPFQFQLQVDKKPQFYFNRNNNLMLKNDTDSYSFDLEFASKNIYGIPERATDFSLKDTTASEPYRLMNLDVFEYETNSPQALYGSIPFLLSHTSTYSQGVYLKNPSEIWVDVIKSDQTLTHWMVDSGNLELYIYTGPTQENVFVQHTSISGKPFLPQYFATAYHQCRWNYNTQQDVEQVDANFDKVNFPYDVLWLDIEHTDQKKYFTFNHEKFPEPLKMIEHLSAKGRKMVTIVDPHIKNDQGFEVSANLRKLGFLMKDKDGQVYNGDCWPGSSNWVDYLDPEARDYWATLFKYDHYKESTKDLYIWNDMNEPAVFNQGHEKTFPRDLVHYGNITHNQVHNIYGMLQHQSTFKGLLLRSQNEDRPFILSRSFFAGTQKYGAIWTGDNAADWEHLKQTIPMLLTISISGLPFAGADVGGFFGDPDVELLTRWYQMAAYQPFFRAHAHIETKRREPFLYPENDMVLMRKSVEERYRLLPFFYTLFQESTRGNPVMRSMMQNFPYDERTFDMDDQFMVGDVLVMKPITESGQKSVQVYLPQTNWYDYHTLGKVKTNKQSLFVMDVTMDTVPVFIKGGSIIPKKQRIRRSSSLMVNDPFTLIIALDKSFTAEGRVYVDDGKGFGYLKGEFIDMKMVFDNDKFTVESGNVREGRFRFDCKVERVVVVGLGYAPSKISYQGRYLVFSIQGDVVTIKKPDVWISDQFEFKFSK